MGRIHGHYEMGQECFHKLEEKKKKLMGMIEPRGEEMLQEKVERITAVLVLEWMSVGGIQYTGMGLSLTSSRTVHPW